MGLSLITLAVRPGLGENLGQSFGTRIITTPMGNTSGGFFDPNVLGDQSGLSDDEPFGKVLGKKNES